MPTWKACTDAASTARDLRPVRRVDASERLVARLRDGVRRRAARSRSSRWSSSDANCAETTAPSAATASSPAMRAIALLTPEAMPAL